MGKFRIRECSDLDYDGMVVDIIYDDKWLATLSCDGGFDKTVIKFFCDNNENPSWEFNFFEFIQVLNNSIKILKEINNLD
ncbi:unknown protein [Waddlia chondrophila 2032/99]|uniref:Uncharacterized protein n=1 Tax=Waddlia chondrophila 2032/99 TaxID=765953 RepID=F8LE98_9BACT|nr:hypothetical protein [Waddlia chondrophila]CCB91813.1 unknown protein [Waddlia chondrophila 2032/99]